jgi:hypothetical protein
MAELSDSSSPRKRHVDSRNSLAELRRLRGGLFAQKIQIWRVIGELSESYRIVALVAFSNIYKNDLFVTSGEVLGLQTVYGHLGMSRSVMQSSAIFVDSIVFLKAAS